MASTHESHRYDKSLKGTPYCTHTKGPWHGIVKGIWFLNYWLTAKNRWHHKRHLMACQHADQLPRRASQEMMASQSAAWAKGRDLMPSHINSQGALFRTWASRGLPGLKELTFFSKKTRNPGEWPTEWIFQWARSYAWTEKKTYIMAHDIFRAIAEPIYLKNKRNWKLI